MPTNVHLPTGTMLAGRYRIDLVLGQGDYGVMYKAWDTRLDNPCALKVNLETSPEAAQQFAQQTAQLAGLRHPNLPVMIDHFTIPGQGQYLVMDFVPGEDLRSMLEKAGGPLDEAVVLPWIGQVCQALTYLHNHQPPVFHRDVKPANIRITPDGNAVLVDFGIAKIFDTTLKTTRGAQAVTTGFSPPELYGYGAADARSDVYALGATLYALLTGQEPTESMQWAVGAELPTPRSLNPRLTPQTEAVILKAMSLLPADRFQTAAELMRTLPDVRVIPGKKGAPPTTVILSPATPISTAKPHRNLWRWLGIFTLLLILLTGGGFVVNQVTNGGLPFAFLTTPSVIPVTATLTPSPTPQPNSTPTQPPPTSTTTFTPSPTPTFPPPTPTLLPTLRLRLPVIIGTSIPSSREVITTENIGRLELLARWGQGTIEEVVWSPDGRLLAVASSIGIYIHDANTLDVVQFIDTGVWVNCVAFSPGGDILAAGMEDSSIRRWLVPTWAPLDTIFGHSGAVLSIAFSPDATILASGSADNTIKLWSMQDDNLLHTLESVTEDITDVVFSSDGESLVSLSSDRYVDVWSVDYGTYIRGLGGGWGTIIAPASFGNYLQAGYGCEMSINRISDGAVMGHASVWNSRNTYSDPCHFESIASAPNNGLMASGSINGVVRIWDMSNGSLILTLEGHTASVFSLAFSPDGTKLVSVSQDGFLRMWQVTDGSLLQTNWMGWPMLIGMTISPDGSVIAAGAENGSIYLVSSSNGALERTIDASSRSHLNFSTNWQLRASGTSSAFSPDGMILVAGHGTGVLGKFRGWDGVFLENWEGYLDWGTVECIAFSPDGAILAAGYSDGNTRLWRVSDGERLRTLVGHEGSVSSLVFSPDGTTLATGSEDNTIILWRVSDRTPLHTLHGHSNEITSLAFSPDGTVLASGSVDRTVRLWRAGDGILLDSLQRHTASVIGVIFSTSGTVLYSGSNDGTIRSWGIPSE